MAFRPLTAAKRIIRPLFGDELLGFLDYARSPDRDTEFGSAFNWQPMRQALFREIIGRLQPEAIIETGTHLGRTTAFIAQTGLPVFTIELDLRRCGYARARFLRSQNIIVQRGDSRTGLRYLFDEPLRSLTRNTLFFYLDAHWNEDLPLAEEIDIIFNRCPAAVVMIDDFQVPNDPGYGFDNYGPGKALTIVYIVPVCATHDLQTFFPSTLSSQEGGLCRGCVVLAKGQIHGRELSSLPLLRLLAC